MTIVQHEADTVRMAIPVCAVVKEAIKVFKVQRGYPTPKAR
jgi:hypothetical protein